MTRRRRIALISIGAIIVLLAITVVTGVILLRSAWMEEKIRERVVAEAERATGGRIEIGALRWNWETLTAELDNLTVHSSEPADAAPLLAVKRVTIGFKILSFLKRDFDVARVEADSPRANVIIQPDGSTNLLRPRFKETVPDIVLALKIGKFDVENGLIAVERVGGNRNSIPWNARGENLSAHVNYNKAGPRYEGTISVAPVNFVWNGGGRAGVEIAAQVTATASMEKTRLSVSTATVKSAQSEIDLRNILVSSFTEPLTTGQYTARVSLAEADKIFKLVNFQHTGILNAEGTFHIVSAKDYLVTSAVRGTGIGYGNVHNMRVSANISATNGKALVTGLRIDALGGEMLADGEVRNFEDFHLAGNLKDLDARMLAALGGLGALPYDGIISGPFDATGKLEESNLHQLMASAALDVAPAVGTMPVRGELTAKYDGAGGTVELGRSWLELPNTRVDLTGILGQRLEIRLRSRNLNDLSPINTLFDGADRLLPSGKNGSVAFDGTLDGAVGSLKIAGHAEIQNAVIDKQQVDSLTGDFSAMNSQAAVTNAVLVSGNLRARVTGSIGLNDWKPARTSAVNANVQLANADIGTLMALAGRKNFPITGTLNTTAQVAGTIGDPHATADLTLVKGQIYGEPYDSVTGRAQYLNSGAQLLTAAINAGRKRVNASLRFDHPDKLTFSVSSNAMALGEIALARKKEPDITGTAQIKADGTIRIDSTRARQPGDLFGGDLLGVDVLDLNADLRLTGLSLDKRSLGDAHFTAETKNGIMSAQFDSNVAKSTVHGNGTVALAGDYPLNAKLTFANLGVSGVTALLRGTTGNITDWNLDGSAAGEVTLSGPVKTPDLLTASVDVTQFELHPLNVTGNAKRIPDLSLRNSGPIHATLSRSVIRVESARFQGPDTNLAVSGSIAMNSQTPFNLRVEGNMNLGLAQTYNPDLSSSGELLVDAAVRGTYTNPVVSGRLELRDGDFHLANIVNGLTNVNGVILFNGKQATVQSLSAESGGGKVEVTGFGTLAGGLPSFRVEARTKDVRIRYPEGVSSTTDADLTLAGTSQRSEASGTVTVRRIAINPKSDVSSILADAAQPMKTAAAGTGFLANMNLDIQIETAGDVTFETSVAQSLEADANLRLRGTAASPAVLGRINVTQGELAFFGNKYVINQGSISFFNPAKIDPILNIDLQTKARGVEVGLRVTGPLNALNVVPRSDPPLQFSDIVALLATGRSPTDPTLAVRDTGQSQNLQQLGASALIGQAIQNPGGGPLQRFFGVSRVKIDPQLTGITGSAETRLTIEQQVSPDIVFTYINDVSSTSTQLIRVEWDFNRKWAAILTREENGYVGLDFAFKKRFK